MIQAYQGSCVLGHSHELESITDSQEKYFKILAELGADLETILWALRKATDAECALHLWTLSAEQFIKAIERGDIPNE